MARTLSAKAQAMLADMPPYEANDPSVQAVVGAVANELQRVEDTAKAIRAALIPTLADDVPVVGGDATFYGLSMLETMVGLPVAPPGQGVEQRRAALLSRLRTHNSAAGSDWVALIETILGTSWNYVEG